MKLMWMIFKSFTIRLAEEEHIKFWDELEKLCKKYAGDDWQFNWRGE